MQRHERVSTRALWQIPPRAKCCDEPRVLIADDDMDATRAICLALEDADFTVRAVHTGLDAVSLARKWRPGVVLLDLMMPLGDGWEAAEAIRAIDLSMLLLAHTSCTDPQDLSRAQRTGFNGYFVKPTELDGMIAVLRDYFSARQGEGDHASVRLR
ncbi:MULTISPECIES: response regulator [Caballeronia]|uniref:Histidine kinase n=1 Tax=Caballeronia zhejiangensis TaxID=871203 RepID=A0A656QL43_9BURK|nr:MULTISPECIES: response regulator [Caballeronia]EKS70497.1 two-component system sensor histidine kinase [Burkholderia sp. SJ98]KDR28971.1 histidine kinase [Caballeronia zhejiangensis]MDR5791018.1 response regulator [Caballeronia sp. LP003]